MSAESESTARPRRLTTERGLDRLVNFSDAVVAIAITLLVLPLADAVTDDPTATLAESLAGRGSLVLSFLITFMVTFHFWRTHHELYELIDGYDANLVLINGLWLLAIVLFPFTSASIGGNGFEGGAGALYLGNMTVLALLLAGLRMYVVRHPELWHPQAVATDFSYRYSLILAAFFALVGLISLPYPNFAPWLMFGLFLLPKLSR